MIFVQPGDSNFFKFVSQPVFIMSESGSEEGEEEETDSGAVSADPASSANTTISEYPTQTRKDIFNQLSDNNQSVAKEVCFESVPPPPPSQVWPLTNFFLLLFFKKIIDLPDGQINDHLSGENFSLQFLPATTLSLSRTLEGLCELRRHSSRAPELASCVDLQRNNDTVRCAALGGKGPRSLSTTVDANLDFAFC